MKGYRDLEIFREAKELAIRVHEMSLKLPKFEQYEEGSQLRRCSKAVVTLIVEGFGRRRYKGDYIRYLIMSHAECDEAIVHLDLKFETRSLVDEGLYEELKCQYEMLSRKINGFVKWIESHD
jgi:four helix bundle protein